MAGFPRLAVALECGGWSVVIEPGGAPADDPALVEAASRGGAAVTVLRDAKGTAHFAYVVDGVTVTAFDPGYPAVETTWGSDPQFLRRLMDALDLRPPSDESEHLWQDAEARAIVLAQRITGVRIPAGPLATARLSAELEPWFVTAAPRRDLLRADRRAPYTGELVAAARAAEPAGQRAVAAAELRRQAVVLGIAGAPGLAEALDAAARGEAGPVGAETALGREVRRGSPTRGAAPPAWSVSWRRCGAGWIPIPRSRSSPPSSRSRPGCPASPTTGPATRSCERSTTRPAERR